MNLNTTIMHQITPTCKGYSVIINLILKAVLTWFSIRLVTACSLPWLMSADQACILVQEGQTQETAGAQVNWMPFGISFDGRASQVADYFNPQQLEAGMPKMDLSMHHMAPPRGNAITSKH